MRPIFAISRRCQVPTLISPDWGELAQSNFQDSLSPHCRFRTCTGILDQEGYVGGGAPQKSKESRKSVFAGAVGEVYRSMDPMLGKFCRHASLLMRASNVARRCCIVPPLGGVDRGTIENYPPPPPPRCCKIPQF